MLSGSVTAPDSTVEPASVAGVSSTSAGGAQSLPASLGFSTLASNENTHGLLLPSHVPFASSALAHIMHVTRQLESLAASLPSVQSQYRSVSSQPVPPDGYDSYEWGFTVSSADNLSLVHCATLHSVSASRAPTAPLASVPLELASCQLESIPSMPLPGHSALDSINVASVTAVNSVFDFLTQTRA